MACSTAETCQDGSCVCPIVPPPCSCPPWAGFLLGNYVCHGLTNGLTSNNNYRLVAGGQYIQGLVVTVQVSSEPGSDVISDNGFSVQLNAVGPGPSTTQQYIFNVSGTSIQATINNWMNDSTQIVNNSYYLCSTPINNGIPAGWSLTIELQYDNDIVTGAKYYARDNSGNLRGYDYLAVDNVGCNTEDVCIGFQPGDASPITEFTVDIVGLTNGQGTNFSSGAGNITYNVTSGQTISPIPNPSSCIGFCGAITVEHSNSNYGTVSACPAQSLNQSFSITPMTCTQQNGSCTGVGGAPETLTVFGVPQTCHSNWVWGQWPWIIACSDGTTVEN